MRKINGFIIVFLCTVMQLNMIVCTEAPPSSEGCDPACFEDQICDVENNQCVVDSGDAAGPFIIAKRSAPCQPIICAIYCKFGNKQDSNGCDICDCHEQDQCPLMFCPGKCSRSRCINEKPGVCPKPFGAGICVELCSGDHSCPGAQKCCSNGCGRACMNPLPTGEKPGVCPQLKRSNECIRGCPSDDSCAGSKKCCQQCCKQGGCGGVCVEPLVCEVNENWKGNFKMKKNVCKKCSCQEMFNKGGKFMKRACKKSKIFKNCCPLCQLVAKKG